MYSLDKHEYLAVVHACQKIVITRRQESTPAFWTTATLLVHSLQCRNRHLPALYDLILLRGDLNGTLACGPDARELRSLHAQNSIGARATSLPEACPSQLGRA